MSFVFAVRPKKSLNRLISIVSKPIKIVVVVIVIVVVVFVQNIRSKRCLVPKNLGQKLFDKRKFLIQKIMDSKQFWVQIILSKKK